MSDQRRRSIKLFDILERVGASEDIRQLHQTSATELEILLDLKYFFLHQQNTEQTVQVNICGSRYEGSVTPDISSDIDIIICISHELTYSMVTDDQAKYPGYIKLQRVLNGQLLTQRDWIQLEGTMYDKMGRLCREHLMLDNMKGPASMFITEDGIHYSDTVFAYKFDTFPDPANEWIHRQRKHGWPSAQQLKTMSTMGCMVVGVGHWESDERVIEWRISFSLQERLLMTSLNPTQHKVYIILKMIKKTILDNLIKRESLTSYQCKTCIFYAVEQTPVSLWCQDNLIRCVLVCLKLLLRWAQDNFCPSYFIPWQNLFSKEKYLITRDQLIHVLEQLIEEEDNLFNGLDNDCVGRFFNASLVRGCTIWDLRVETETRKRKYILELKKRFISCTLKAAYRILSKFNDPLLALGLLQSLDTIADHTKSQTSIVKTYLEPWFHLHTAKYLAAIAIYMINEDSAKTYMMNVDEHFRRAARTDVTSVKFAKASILYVQDKYEECRALLQEIENNLTTQIMNICPCQVHWRSYFKDEKQRHDQDQQTSRMRVADILQNHISSCVMFMRSEYIITPTALQYEMYHSLVDKPISRDDTYDSWVDQAVVDARVFLFFMQYLVFSKLQMNVHKQVAVHNIKAEIESCNQHIAKTGEMCLSHKETAYNLLGWIHVQESNMSLARQYFMESLKIRPNRNAAKVHLRDIS